MISRVVLNFILVICSNASELIFLLLDSQPWLERFYELSLSVLQSRGFFEIGSLVFSGFQHGGRGPKIVCGRALFFEDIIFLQKWGKCAKNEPEISFLKFIGKFSH